VKPTTDYPSVAPRRRLALRGRDLRDQFAEEAVQIVAGEKSGAIHVSNETILPRAIAEREDRRVIPIHAKNAARFTLIATALADVISQR
jgi:hypothetical protein